MPWAQLTASLLICSASALFIETVHDSMPASGYDAPTGYRHAVPCPKISPDAVSTFWSITSLNPVRHAANGKRVTTNKADVANLYSDVCSVTLVKFDHPVITACPAAFGSATYKLSFTRRTRSLLRVTERSEGCSFLQIDGHRNLGYAPGVLLLPPGIPVLSPPHLAVTPVRP